MDGASCGAAEAANCGGHITISRCGTEMYGAAEEAAEAAADRAMDSYPRRLRTCGVAVQGLAPGQRAFFFRRRRRSRRRYLGW